MSDILQQREMCGCVYMYVVCAEERLCNKKLVK